MENKAGWQLDDWLCYLETLHPQEIDLGLERVARVYQRLGSPRPANKIISIAGTNGKGSVSAHIMALAAASGLQAGSYTSPHLLAYNERFDICGQWAAKTTVCHAFTRIDTARSEVSLSYFEFSTLAGILLMAEQFLDVAVFEVGLGGRLDAVNILAADCAVITSIALDHQQWLGDTRDQIAREKAGIFRQRGKSSGFRQSIVIGEREPPSGLLQAAGDSGQDVSWLGADFDWCPTVDDRQIKITCKSTNAALILPRSPLSAPIQNDNLSVALCALTAVCRNLSVDTAALKSAFKRLPLRGRLEQINSRPDIYVDVAHNPAAAEVLARWLSIRQTGDKSSGKIWAVCAMLVDKDSREVCRILDPWIDSWSFAGLEGSRGQSAESLLLNVSAVISQSNRCYRDVASALKVVAKLATADDLILIFGSFLTVEQAIRHWNE